MTKEELDRLYHLLRVASNSQLREETHTILGLGRHLLAGGDYLSLIQYSAYYGGHLLVKPTVEAIQKAGWSPNRIVEFGAGLGWLGRGLAAGLGMLPTLFVDKRPWTLIDAFADLEGEQGRQRVLSMMARGDLIVMADFLHCVSKPEEILEAFADWPMAILEYCPTDVDYADSYREQLTRYGANPMPAEAYEEMFPGRVMDAVDLDPYVLLLVERRAK